MALDARRTLIFRAVARAGSISAAARDLGWTQPAVSQHLARLEREAGGPLLLRGPGGVTLTGAGAALLRRADVVAAELHAAAEELAALTHLRAGRVRLVAFPSAAATVVPDAIGALAAAHPEVEVGLEEAEPPEALVAVAAGDADLALVFGYDGAPVGLGTLTWRPLLDEPVHLVLPPGRRAPGRGGLATLAAEDWIGGCVRCRTHLVDCCEAVGFTPTIRHTTDDYVVVQNLVARGLGVTALPESALTAYRHPDVQVLALPALGRRHVGVAHRPGAEIVPATAALVARIVAAAAA
ncbi:LysR family transcriptional regulator [Nocardioides dongxiaopingii]|uniref:LysR family transcriptional regulator n=1 Tax=Nocardioides sp. S-1144 TaxID=2582905 RepID=UPI00110D7FB6|nr:LysR family transcriptional regulator [Nocardioides sp. S-1144]QCW52046.1 LysR family transcriptional regulator [Nocardioides sp. S-1144]